jgi:hypothetical protein
MELTAYAASKDLLLEEMEDIIAPADAETLAFISVEGFLVGVAIGVILC